MGLLQAKAREAKNLPGCSLLVASLGSAKGSEFTQAGSREGQEGSEQGPLAGRSGGPAGKHDRQRKTLFF